ILDATQVSAYWPLGQVHNDFARQLKKLEPDIKKVPNLVVICASDTGQRSWGSPERGTSIFAHFVLEGLRGAAEHTATSTRDGRITARELFDYVRDGVRQWVRDNR